MKPRRVVLLGLAMVTAGSLVTIRCAHAAAPVVSNVRASQRPGTKLVDIYYDVADADSATLAVSVAVSTNGGASYMLPATSFSGNGFGTSVTPGSNKKITWDAGADWNGRFSANVRFQVTADDAAVPSGMVLIPAGAFTMGNCMDTNEGNSDELPLHMVYVSAFYMDRYLVTSNLWWAVKVWNGGNGYSYNQYFPGSGKAANHPVQTITWYDMVKWCNARSQKEGLTPCYFTDAGLTIIYKSGEVEPYVNWSANGYRLPTEAEWEKAARGGASGHRFPWSDTDTIQHSRANYFSYGTSINAYDTSPTLGYHPAFNDGVYPYTSPVGYFAANGYGLYDMAGNVYEWCWDWYDFGYYASSPGADPRGPTSGPERVLRGGCWGPSVQRCAFRFIDIISSYGESLVGFRCVKGS